ncbi:hypothetical protein JCM8202_001919 [Rhodotorula sphaerocarpa]
MSNHLFINSRRGGGGAVGGRPNGRRPPEPPGPPPPLPSYSDRATPSAASPYPYQHPTPRGPAGQAQNSPLAPTGPVVHARSNPGPNGARDPLRTAMHQLVSLACEEAENERLKQTYRWPDLPEDEAAALQERLRDEIDAAVKERERALAVSYGRFTSAMLDAFGGWVDQAAEGRVEAMRRKVEETQKSLEQAQLQRAQDASRLEALEAAVESLRAAGPPAAVTSRHAADAADSASPVASTSAHPADDRSNGARAATTDQAPTAAATPSSNSDKPRPKGSAFTPNDRKEVDGLRNRHKQAQHANAKIVEQLKERIDRIERYLAPSTAGSEGSSSSAPPSGGSVSANALPVRAQGPSSSNGTPASTSTSSATADPRRRPPSSLAATSPAAASGSAPAQVGPEPEIAELRATVAALSAQVSTRLGKRPHSPPATGWSLARTERTKALGGGDGATQESGAGEGGGNPGGAPNGPPLSKVAKRREGASPHDGAGAVAAAEGPAATVPATGPAAVDLAPADQRPASELGLRLQDVEGRLEACERRFGRVEEEIQELVSASAHTSAATRGGGAKEASLGDLVRLEEDGKVEGIRSGAKDGERAGSDTDMSSEGAEDKAVEAKGAAEDKLDVLERRVQTMEETYAPQEPLGTVKGEVDELRHVLEESLRHAPSPGAADHPQALLRAIEELRVASKRVSELDLALIAGLRRVVDLPTPEGATIPPDEVANRVQAFLASGPERVGHLAADLAKQGEELKRLNRVWDVDLALIAGVRRAIGLTTPDGEPLPPAEVAFRVQTFLASGPKRIEQVGASLTEQGEEVKRLRDGQALTEQKFEAFGDLSMMLTDALPRYDQIYVLVKRAQELGLFPSNEQLLPGLNGRSAPSKPSNGAQPNGSNSSPPAAGA